MNTTINSLVQKLWNYCNVLRDDGMSYGDYVEQLTYLLFLKMADERSAPPYNQPSIVPAAYAWPTLLAKDGDELFDHYRHALEKLGQEKGTLGLIFGKAQNKFQDPAKLRRVIVDLIDAETWTILGADVKGDAYEGLLEKNAQDTKSGAGQYFTPRALIQAMVDCIAPQPGERITDPACGTGGFLFTAHNYITKHNKSLTRDQLKHLKEKAFTGYELVQGTARVCAMNMMLHGIGSEKQVPVVVGDALAADPGERFEVVLAKSGQRLTVPQDKSILEVLRVAGVPVPSSCESGTCGSCRTPLVSGDVDHRDFVLMDDEQSSQIMVCVSRAKGPTLVLDL